MKNLDLATAFCAICCLSVSACDKQAEPDASSAASDDTPPSTIVVGADLPDFELTSLEDPEVTYTRSDVEGKIYLIDFWATWCLPCVAELPNLHEAYENYGDRGFEILSVAMGDRRGEIARLRDNEWPMPWLHGFEPLDSEVAELFELFGVPKAILVDSTHTIIGIDEDVRGERLQETLFELFGETS